MMQSVTNSVASTDWNILGQAYLSRSGASSTKSVEGDGGSSKKPPTGAAELTPAQQQQVAALKQTDSKVRAHEQAHMAAGGELVRGGPTFSYTTGPDNKRYAVGGEVSIDTTPGRSPAETIPKAQRIRAAALAPAEPSSQDQSVAAQASQMEVQARQDLALQQREEAAESDGGTTGFYQGNRDASQLGGRLDLFA
jgi:hypothetical protein